MLFLTSCFDDDASISLTPIQALEGQWEVDRGFFIWDNGSRISSLNPLVDSLPPVQLQFTEDNRYKIQYAFYVTNGFDQDTITITNGVQEGTFELMASEDQLLEYSGDITLIENITNTTDEAEISYQLGQGADSLWLEEVQLNSLLIGEISGVYVRNTR
jgi:hypothetical protein